MGLLGRLTRRRRTARPDGAPSAREAQRATLAHLTDFVRTRVGVEAYVEPATQDTPVTLMLIATTGEWTRRRVPDERTARTVARDLGIPVYDVRFVGYPQRMRDWNSRQRPRRFPPSGTSGTSGTTGSTGTTGTSGTSGTAG